jgi:hypothetical protein
MLQKMADGRVVSTSFAKPAFLVGPSLVFLCVFLITPLAGLLRGGQ